MPDEGKADQIIILRLTTKSEKNRIYEKMLRHGHPQPECLYPQNGIGWLLLES